jgi:hypothetical protein
MGEWLFGPSALGGSTPNWAIIAVAIIVCFKNQLASWSSERLLAGFEAPQSALGVTSSSDPEPTLPEE